MEPTQPFEVEMGAVLRKARDRRGISVRTLAAQLGLDHSDLSRIERGRATTLEKYDRIGRALGLVLVVRFRPEARRAA